MRINTRASLIYFSLGLSVFCFSLKISGAVPASYQAIQDLKDSEKQEPQMVIEVSPVEYTADNLRDPFEPGAFQEESDLGEQGFPNQTDRQAPAITIQGIIWGGNLPQAIINDRVVKIGDTVEGVPIIDISKEGVTLFYNGQEQKITSPAVDMLKNQQTKPKGGRNERGD
jgi:hypothetical protein